jgi:predicted hotdog family 3-hydroxylacyl-ACP dehydratase
MVGPREIAALVPHQGRMCLLERVLEWDAERLLAIAVSHRATDHPLASGGRLRALHLCEYAAQAMAVHGGLAAQAAGARAAPGMLVSLRDVELHLSSVESLPGELLIEVRRLLDGGNSWQYAFTVRHAGLLLVSGRAAILTVRGP